MGGFISIDLGTYQSRILFCIIDINATDSGSMYIIGSRFSDTVSIKITVVCTLSQDISRLFFSIRESNHLSNESHKIANVTFIALEPN
jgi:hypothetical protein